LTSPEDNQRIAAWADMPGGPPNSIQWTVLDKVTKQGFLRRIYRRVQALPFWPNAKN